MKPLKAQTVEILHLFRHGHLIATALSEADLYSVAPSLRDDADKTIVVEKEQVGIVQGEVLNWSKHGGHSFNPKLHWFCPNCGQQWFDDFTGVMPNPTFVPSGCNCVRYWLVHWDRDNAEAECS